MRIWLALGVLALPLLGAPGVPVRADDGALSAEEEALLEEIDLLLELEMLEAWDAIDDAGAEDVASEDPAPEQPAPRRLRQESAE
jgi:hypothetical protein